MPEHYSNTICKKVCEDALNRIIDGDTDALSDIYEVMGKQIIALSISILHDESYAEDAMQETFIKIIERISTYRKDGNARAWIMSIARNTAIDIQKKRCHIDELDENTEYEDDESKTLNVHLSVDEALRNLSMIDRQIVVMKCMASLKHKEIGDILNLSEDAVQKRYKRALGKLRTMLK